MLFVLHTDYQHTFHIIICSSQLIVTRQLLPVQHDQLILPEHPAFTPLFSGVRVTPYKYKFTFLCSILQIIFCPFLLLCLYVI